MSARLPLALVALGMLAAGTAGASPGVQKSVAAHAYSVRILVPGQPAAGTSAATSPPDAVALGGSYSYPADGSVVVTGSMSASASTNVAPRSADAHASSEVDALQLFRGEITADTLISRAAVTATPQSGSPDVAGQAITGLVILGQAVTPTANLRVPLADWGFAVVLEQATDTSAPSGRAGSHATAAALDVHLTAPHGGLPAGSQILVGPVEASAVVKAAPPPAPQPPPPPPPGGGGPGPTVQHPHPKPAGGKTTPSKPPEPTTSPFGSPIVHVPSPKVHPKLAAGNYVFPVYGPVSYTDTFGSPRADVGWHHGDDIFAPLGAPVLAVANGTVFSVGWNDLGGNRLWLKDSQGNEFYYAHLSAYSPLAANGARVKAGDVLGFVGNTGDAITTPYHLHFEIHPVSLLFKGYDGVVDPTGYLNAWRRLRDLSFSGGVTPSSATYAARTKTSPSAPLPGVVLLKSADISSASGLDERSIRRALAAELDVAANEGLGAVVGAPGSAGAPKG